LIVSRFLDITSFNCLQETAEDLVTQFRARFGFPNCPPVPVEMIAQASFGLKCELVRFRLGHRHTLGALSVEHKIIYGDERNHHRQGYVFTLAHEIGHWVMHKHSLCQDHGNCGIVPLRSVLASTRAKTKRDKSRLSEIEANRFAAALLMPHSFLASAAREYAVIGARAVRELARVFAVSPSAMLYRIEDMSEHQAWAGPRIDWISLRCSKSGLYADYSNARFGQIDARLKNGAISDRVGGQSWLEAGPVVNTRPADHSANAAPAGKRRSVTPAVATYLRRGRGNRNRDSERPFIVELAGTPNSGKDSAISIVKNYLEDVHGFGVRVFDEAVNLCHIERDRDVDIIYKTVALAVTRLYEAALEDPGYDFVIFNRGLFDRVVFLHAMRARGRITEEQRRIHVDYLCSYAHLQDCTAVFLVSPAVSLQREAEREYVRRLFSERDGGSKSDLPEQAISNLDMLEQLNSSYLRMYHAHKESFGNQIHLFDSTAGNEASTLDQARTLVDIMLPRRLALSPFADLSDLPYVRCNLQVDRAGRRQPRMSGVTPQAAVQLPLSWS
jgi:Zn-dependent peptidase ImmA (M78 family)